MTIASEERIAKFRTFIENYYYNELLATAKKGYVSLYVDFPTLAKFDLDLSEELITHFVEVIKDGEEAIKQFDIPGVEEPIKLRIINLPKADFVQIRHIRSKHLGRLIYTEGLIRQASDIRPKATLATFECPGCGAQILVEQRGNKFSEPHRCQCGRKGKFRLLEKKLVDVQRLVMEESPEGLGGGEQPKRLNVFLEGDLLDPFLDKRRYPGNKIKVVGIIKEVATLLRSGGQSTTYDLLIDANSVETIEEEFEELQITKEEETEIKELASKTNIYDRLIQSIAPSIEGHDNIKKAIALQLFGGVKKERVDGTRTRGDFHIFLVGDPGSGKSEMLRYICTLAPKARYSVGRGSSAAGLTASVVKDEFMKGWALEAGILVLANKGIAVLDEMDKMSQEDSSAMHEALEQQTVTIAKANIHATLRSETSVLAAANPKFGRFDPFAAIANQIDMPPALLNRFDLIFPIRDIPDAHKDEKIAQHILELARDPKVKQPEIEITLLRKYIAYAKQHCHPTLTLGAMDEIKNFYVGLRKSAAAEEGEVKSIPISARQLEALVRLAESSAKVRLSDKVTKKDAQRAIALLRSSMEEVAMDMETGKFDIDRISSGITAKQRNQISVIRRVIDSLTEKLGKNIPLADILDQAEQEGVDRAKTEEVIENLKKKGDIFEPKQGLISKIG